MSTKPTQQPEKTFSTREMIEAQHKVVLPISDYVLNKKRFPIIVIIGIILQFMFSTQYGIAILAMATYTLYKAAPLQVQEKDGNLIFIGVQYLKKIEKWFYTKLANLIEKYMHWY